MTISIIAALSENRVIGWKGELPWRLPADLRRFRSLTDGHALIVGRKTFDSIGGPLPRRRIIVVTRDPGWRAEGVTAARGLDEALGLAGEDDVVFIGGGGEIYEMALDRADRMHLTIVHAAIDGDAWFPSFDPEEWNLVFEERHDADEDHAHAFSFRDYERR